MLMLPGDIRHDRITQDFFTLSIGTLMPESLSLYDIDGRYLNLLYASKRHLGFSTFCLVNLCAHNRWPSLFTPPDADTESRPPRGSDSYI